MTIIELLANGISKMELSVSSQQIDKLLEHLNILSKWNKVHNLTSITDLEQMVKLHVLDSLSINKHLHGSTFIDIGTGAGFPGLSLAILNPNIHFTLLDSSEKKCQFLKHVKNELSVENVNVLQSRVENCNNDVLYDGVITRAMASARWVFDNASHLLKDDGAIYLMLAKNIEIPKELQAISHLIPLTVAYVDVDRHLLKLKNTGTK